MCYALYGMYIPSVFEMHDPVQLAGVISRYNFATVISRDGNSSFASHLPFLYHPKEGGLGILVSHMARANRHWQLFNDDEEVLVIFQGPHSYISPNWYVSEVAVPTWNYVTVHAYGKARIMETDSELDAVLDETVSKHESNLPQPWTPRLPDELKTKLRQAIVGFQIDITRLEGKFKLGQNRSKEDQEKMLESLRNQPDHDANQLAKFIEEESA